MAKQYQDVRKVTSNVTKKGGRVTISNVFAGVNSKGITPDERGWYKIWGGAFNTQNFRGDFYPMPAKLHDELTSPGSAFNLRMANGLLGGECNHPDIAALPNVMAQKARLNRIDKTRECLQVMQLELDAESYKNKDGSPVIGFWVWVKPTGAHATAFKNALEDPDIQVVLSIRTESRNTLRPNMTWVREVTAIAAIDWVDIQGMAGATKMESLEYSMEDMHCIQEVEITAGDIPRIEAHMMECGYSMEDASSSLDNLKTMLSEIQTDSLQPTSEAYNF